MDPRSISWIHYFLNSLKTVLTAPERNFVKDVFFKATTAAKWRIEFSPENDDEIYTKNSILKENIMLMVDLLEQCNESKNDFIQKFPNWRDLRMKNVESLKSLGNSMHNWRLGCNITRVAGNATSLVGGIASIASAISIPFTFGLTTPLAIAGGTMVGLGTAASAGGNITETTVMVSKIQSAKDTLDNDKKSLEDLQKWLKNANDLSEAIKSISQLDLGKDVINTICKFNGVTTKIKKNFVGKECARKFVKLVFDILNPNLLTNALMVGPLVSYLSILALLYNKNYYILDYAYQTAATIAEFAPLLCATGSIIDIVSTVIETDFKISSNAIKAVSKGTVFGIVVDVAGIVLSSIDIYKGSLSEKGTEIIKIAEKMGEETDTLLKIYETVALRFIKPSKLLPKVFHFLNEQNHL